MTTRTCNRLMILLATAGLAAFALAEVPEPPEPVESDIVAAQAKAQWVRRVTEASQLLGGGRSAEALAAFESLQREMPGLDSDGVVALAIGDCLFQLQQYEKAYAAYEQAAALHPHLAEVAWIRLVETELALERFDEVASRLRQVLAGSAPADQKAWASLRLGNVQEAQAIQLLGQAEQAYRRATGMVDELTGSRLYGQRWSRNHAEDLKDATTQMQIALRQLMEGNDMMPVVWPGPSQTVTLPSAEVAKVKISGHIKIPGEKDSRARAGKDKDGKETVELVVEKDGKVEATVAGRKVDLDATTQRQILKHLQYTLRVAGQASQEPARKVDNTEE